MSQLLETARLGVRGADGWESRGALVHLPYLHLGPAPALDLLLADAGSADFWGNGLVGTERQARSKQTHPDTGVCVMFSERACQEPRY